MNSVTETEFVRNFGRHSTDAEQGPIAVTSCGRVTGYYVSAHEFEEMKRAIEGIRKSHTLRTMPDHLWSAIMEAKVGPGFSHLDKLLEDEQKPASR